MDWITWHSSGQDYSPHSPVQEQVVLVVLKEKKDLEHFKLISKGPINLLFVLNQCVFLT